MHGTMEPNPLLRQPSFLDLVRAIQSMYITLKSRVGFLALDKCQSSPLHHTSTIPALMQNANWFIMQSKYKTAPWEKDGGMGHEKMASLWKSCTLRY